MLYELRRCETPVVTQHCAQLKRVHHRLATGVIVRKYERVGSMLLDLIDARLPFQKLLARIEIIVGRDSPGRSAELGLPMLRIASMQSHISDPRSQQRRGRHS